MEQISTGDFVGAHKYSNPGTYTISYSFKDSEGNKAMAPPVTVTAPDGTTAIYSVSGTICAGANNGDNDCTDAGEGPVPNAAVYLKKGQTIVKMGKTDSTGYYVIPNVPTNSGDSYTIVPSKNGYSFTPSSRAVSSTSYTNINFTAIVGW